MPMKLSQLGAISTFSQSEFEEDVLPLAMHGFVQRLKEIISKDLGKEVDIIRFEQAQTNMDLSALENIRSIF